MTDTYFAFSDECGDYKPLMNEKAKASHPFYVRCTLLINANEWKQLSLGVKKLKERYLIPSSVEIKWADLWTFKKLQESSKLLHNKHSLKIIENVPYLELLNYVADCLDLINNIGEKKIIATYTNNNLFCRTSERYILEFHLQEHMQRINMELDIKGEDNLAVLFLDPVSKDKNDMFKDIYYNLYMNGDFFNNYPCIKDCLNFENSHHSCGIQLADYISGCFSAVLKSNKNYLFSDGVKMFFQSVYPNLRKSNYGALQGYGIREVPSNRELRRECAKRLIELKNIFNVDLKGSPYGGGLIRS